MLADLTRFGWPDPNLFSALRRVALRPRFQRHANGRSNCPRANGAVVLHKVSILNAGPFGFALENGHLVSLDSRSDPSKGKVLEPRIVPLGDNLSQSLPGFGGSRNKAEPESRDQTAAKLGARSSPSSATSGVRVANA